eukprot:gene10071-2241_t
MGDELASVCALFEKAKEDMMKAEANLRECNIKLGKKGLEENIFLQAVIFGDFMLKEDAIEIRIKFASQLEYMARLADCYSLGNAFIRLLGSDIEERTLSIKEQSQSEAINSLVTELPEWPVLRYTPLCGAFPAPEDMTLVPGYEVAAFVENNWILTVIVDMDLPNNMYKVEDILTKGKGRYELPRSSLIALPVWRPRIDFTQASFPLQSANVHVKQHFLINEHVLAMYPRTTCFYQATVHRPPMTGLATYSIHFDDDEDFGDGRVRYHEIPVKYVLNFTRALNSSL